MKKRATKAESDHMDAVAALGCIIDWTPAEIHHIDRDRNHYRVIPLCPDHHRNGPCGVAVHQGRRSFVAAFGTEEELLKKTNQRLGMLS